MKTTIQIADFEMSSHLPNLAPGDAVIGPIKEPAWPPSVPWKLSVRCIGLGIKSAWVVLADSETKLIFPGRE